MGLEMSRSTYGKGYTGLTYFIRGRDAYDSEVTSSTGSPVVNFTDTVLNQGHPSCGDFTHFIYYLNYETQPDAGGSVSFRDQQGTTVWQESLSPDTNEGVLGAVPAESDEYQLLVNMNGDGPLHLRIAGGIEYVSSV